jgi:hypothetical protein
MMEHVHDAHHKKGVNAFALQPGGVLTQMAAGNLPDGKGWEESKFKSEIIEPANEWGRID